MAVPRNQIFIGSLDDPDYYFENDEIASASTGQAVALVGQELSIDTFSPVVRDKVENGLMIYRFRSSDGKEIRTVDGQEYVVDIRERTDLSPLVEIKDGTPIWYFHRESLVGKFYVDSIKRQAKNWYKINTVSAIGRLSKTYHGGGLFQRSTFGAVLRHILAAGLHGNGSPIVEYAIDDDVADLPVSGWLPYASKRNNLYQLIFANGVNIIKNTDGNPRFTFLYTAGSSSEPIANTDIFQGGSVEYVLPYSSVSIMEHTYSALLDVTPAVLYDNTESSRVSNEEIWFDQAPIIVSTLEATEGLTIVSATENSAVITGNGKLTGVPYTHTTRTVSRANAVGDREKTASVTDCTMVNTINSENLLNRLFAFYCPPDFIKKITNDIVYREQRCGKSYVFSSPYGEREVAHLVSLDIRASSFNRSTCEFYSGYNPVGQAGLFQHCIILDKSTFEQDGGTFVLPEEIFEQEHPQIRVVMIGGGTGGWSGWPGENGQDATTYTEVSADADISSMIYGAEGGDGGQGGDGGEPGRVLAVTINDPATSYQYTIGDGGEGGAATGFIPDTESELRSALEAEEPDHEYSDAEVRALLEQEFELTDWSGESNMGSSGTATTFGGYTTADDDAYVPVGGVYNPIFGDFYAKKGNKGVSGGKGGARRLESNGSFLWVTSGEDIVVDGVTYEGGKTGQPMNRIDGLPEAKFIAYGGNGAGAAVGIRYDINSHMNGYSDAHGEWEVIEDGI